jgi:hypothetical protein
MAHDLGLLVEFLGDLIGKYINIRKPFLPSTHPNRLIKIHLKNAQIWLS